MQISAIEKVSLVEHVLDFMVGAVTSRGTLLEHKVHYLILEHKGKIGVGEIAPLPKLSIDFGVDFNPIVRQINWDKILVQSELEVLEFVKNLNLEAYPSLVFALETALLDLLHGGKRMIFDSPFYTDEFEMPINGLVWMNSKENMLEQIERKIIDGFTCIKMKIGKENLVDVLQLIEMIRQVHKEEKLTIRVDANGAFNVEQAKKLLTYLADLGVHSIEQPIAVGKWEEMRELCEVSKVGIALDEELIGVHALEDRIKLLDTIEPHFLILKPTLLGGFKSCDNWIELAQEREIDFWMTSALESNIGLNAICQYTNSRKIEGYQGLGTGQLYHNNIPSPLTIDYGHIYYDQNKNWELSL